MLRSDDLMITLAIQGDLERWAQEAKTGILQAVADAAKEEGREGLERLREDVRNAGLGDGVANAWRMDVKPRNRLAYSPAVFFHSAAPHIIEAFTKGQPIKGKPLLAVPIPDSPADKIRIRRGQERTAEIEKRYGPLRAINLKGGGVMLVARGRASSDGAGVRALVRRRATGTKDYFTPINQKNQVDIPMFWLIPNVRLGKRLNWPEIARQIQADYAQRVEANIRKRLANAGSALLNPSYGAAQRAQADALQQQWADQYAANRLMPAKEIDW